MFNPYLMRGREPEQVSREGFVYDGEDPAPKEEVRRYHELGSLVRIAEALEAMQDTLARMERRMAQVCPLKRGRR